MQNHPVQISDVIYNPAAQHFEALVTVHDGPETRKYACAVEAPITMSFEDASKGLSRQALRRHATGDGLCSATTAAAINAEAGRARFDPVRWLQDLANFPGRRLA